MNVIKSILKVIITAVWVTITLILQAIYWSVKLVEILLYKIVYSWLSLENWKI
jgi:hypothetical protein